MRGLFQTLSQSAHWNANTPLAPLEILRNFWVWVMFPGNLALWFCCWLVCVLPFQWHSSPVSPWLSPAGQNPNLNTKQEELFLSKFGMVTSKPKNLSFVTPSLQVGCSFLTRTLSSVLRVDSHRPESSLQWPASCPAGWPLECGEEDVGLSWSLYRGILTALRCSPLVPLASLSIHIPCSNFSVNEATCLFCYHFLNRIRQEVTAKGSVTTSLDSNLS